MLKVGHPIDYLKKEGIDSQVVDWLERDQQRMQQDQKPFRSRIRRHDPSDTNIAKLFIAIREHRTGNPQLDKVSEIEGLLIQVQNINDIDRNDDDNTPLHVAVSKGHQDIVKLLLEGGANVVWSQGVMVWI